MFLLFLALSELVPVETGYSKLLFQVANEFYQRDVLDIEYNEGRRPKNQIDVSTIRSLEK